MTHTHTHAHNVRATKPAELKKAKTLCSFAVARARNQQTMTARQINSMNRMYLYEMKKVCERKSERVMRGRNTK